MVIAEAMAVGVPVVATRVGAIGEMIRHDVTGLLYAPGDVDALTGCLQRVLSNREIQQRIGDAARKWAVDAYAPERVGQTTVSVYRELLGQRCRPARVSTYTTLEAS